MRPAFLLLGDGDSQSSGEEADGESATVQQQHPQAVPEKGGLARNAGSWRTGGVGRVPMVPQLARMFPVGLKQEVFSDCSLVLPCSCAM